jgi:hypothetical protein
LIPASFSNAQELLHAKVVHGLNGEAVVNEFRGPRILGKEIADLRHRKEAIPLVLFGKETDYDRIVGKIEFGMRPGNKSVASLLLQTANNGEPAKAAMARNISNRTGAPQITHCMHTSCIRAS